MRERFVWVRSALGRTAALHAVVEEQIATMQDAFCGQAPPTACSWARASAPWPSSCAS